MKEPFKKKILVLLLLFSCLISGYIFMTVSDTKSNHLRDFAQVDSLIRQDLQGFNLGPEQIQTETIAVDSTFDRKVFHVEVPVWMAKSQLHAELNTTFYDYAIATPARVHFPEKHMEIHLFYQDTVIRTIFLETQETQSSNQN